MATKNYEANLVNYDWDDTELIRAYDEGIKMRKSLENGTLPKTKKNSKAKNTSKQWRVGDFCKALYADDNQYYEAKIESLDEDNCVVEYYGYNESAVVSIRDLKPSDGKNARKRQQRLVSAGERDFTSASETCEESNNISYRRSYTKKKMNDSCSMNHGAYDTTHHETTMNETTPFNHTTMGPYFPPNNVPCMPSALPIPQCPNMTSNPALQNMLVAWYMAGYYSGIHQGQKGCSQQCSMQRCCSHSNQCCHH